MCLAVPGKVLEFVADEPPFVAAMVDFGGIRRRVSLACVPEAVAGDYVLVHAGIAISRVNQLEAERALAALAQLGLTEEEEMPLDLAAEPNRELPRQSNDKLLQP